MTLHCIQKFITEFLENTKNMLLLYMSIKTRKEVKLNRAPGLYNAACATLNIIDLQICIIKLKSIYQSLLIELRWTLHN